MQGYIGQLLSHTLERQGEVRGISRQSAAIHVIVYYPKTEEGKRELARRVADVHADVVHQAIQKLNCPSAQKLETLAGQAFKGVYEPALIARQLRRFLKRFFTQQFKRNCAPDGPKVGSISLSPRGDLRMPSDMDGRMWLD